MAKKDNTMTYIIVALAVMLIGYLLFRNKDGSTGRTGYDSLPQGCYPFEEVHEIGKMPGQMFLSIIKYLADGTTSPRPPASATSNGRQVEVKNTDSALDGVYTINDIWYDLDGKIGAFRVDTPGGYNFNYNATQGNPPQPRDMTYFGIGQICLI